MKSIFFRILFVLTWGFVLFTFTCTKNLEKLLFHQHVHFLWNRHPHFAELLKIKDAHYWDPYWIFIKTGHFSGFAIFDLALFFLIRRKNISLSLSILYAVATEILQLYFYRDGRLIDIGIDSCGAILMYVLISWFTSKQVNAKKLDL